MHYKDIKSEHIHEAIKNTKSMMGACAYLGIAYTTFIRRAKALGVYTPNQGGKGLTKPSKKIIPLENILAGEVPQYLSHPLRKRLIKDKILEPKCYSCEGTEWLGKPIPLELEHIDGNKYNHKRENLTLLCPNCHTFTPTYKSKNLKYKLRGDIPY